MWNCIKLLQWNFINWLLWNYIKIRIKNFIRNFLKKTPLILTSIPSYDNNCLIISIFPAVHAISNAVSSKICE